MEYVFSHRPYRLPLCTTLRTAHGLWSEREGLIVRLESGAGEVGFGEIAPIPWFGTETMAEAQEICRRFGDRVTDAGLDQVPARMGAVRFALAAAKSEVNRGLRARAAEQLETESRQAPAFQQSKARVPVTALLPAGKAVLSALPPLLEAGWLSFKWKVGVGTPDEEMGLLDDLCAALPGYAKLRLDANGAWNRKQAEKWLARCADRPVEFVEQPVAPEDESALHGLAEDFPVKLALDESVVQLDEARRWQAEGWPGVFVIKPALAGPLEDIAAWAMANEADIVLSSAIETAVGRATILRFALQHRAVLLRRAPGFGVGGIFGDRRWDGPVMGAVLDDGWSKAVNPEELWNGLS
ncbi:MAG TPA: o-succinylbenzoate synthase [Lacunisphaera sp.]|nr:o-succinylbenzoate synthase [Lacunisphaera sp.]